MRLRSNLWAARVAGEYRRSKRTWMVTFTLSPAEHALLDIEANKFRRDGVEWIDCQCRAYDARISLWLKRCRSEAFRQGRPVVGNTKTLRVAEVHDSDKTSDLLRGRPHFHMLLHEREIGSLIRDEECEWVQERDKHGVLQWLYRAKDEALVRAQWTFGHTKFTLCFEEKQAYYLCKYLHKKPIYRIKAGIGYYRRDLDDGSDLISAEQLPEAARAERVDASGEREPPPGGLNPFDERSE